MEPIFEALQFLGVLLLVVMVFNLIILVHEWGHFLAARWRGLQIDKFQIWFGKPIWKRTWNGVQYGLGSIPAGGFVALPQMAPMEAIEGGSDGVERREKLPPIKPLDKIIVAFAGPLFSLLLAFAFAAIVWIVGTPERERVTTTTIGYVEPGGPAAEAGLQPGDVIKSIDGERIERFHGMVDSVDWAIIGSEGEQIEFLIDRPGEGEMRIPVDAPDVRKGRSETSWWRRLFTRPDVRRVGIAGKETPVIRQVKENSPAAEAGLRPRDLLKSMDGQPVLGPAQVADYVGARGGESIELTVERDGRQMTVTAVPRPPKTPESVRDTPMLGIAWDPHGIGELAHPGPFEQVGQSLQTMAETISKVVSPKSDVSAAHLSGPIGIGHLYYRLFEHPDGWRLVLWFSVVLNVNLAVLNLLPFPVLDGGHILMASIEGVRRKPLNFKVLEIIQMACVILLFGFIIFVTMKDVGDIWGRGEGDADAKVKEITF